MYRKYQTERMYVLFLGDLRHIIQLYTNGLRPHKRHRPLAYKPNLNIVSLAPDDKCSDPKRDELFLLFEVLDTDSLLLQILL